MSRKIKITNEQYKSLQEDNDYDVGIYTNNTIKPNIGLSYVSVEGGFDNDDLPNPTTTDDFQKQLTTQNYNCFRGGYGRPFHSIKEGVKIDNDKNNDGVDDFYNNKELDTLTNGNINDDLTKIPSSVESKINKLINIIDTNNMTGKQKAIILNKLLTDFNFSGVPYSWKKELMLKIMNKK